MLLVTTKLQFQYQGITDIKYMMCTCAGMIAAEHALCSSVYSAPKYNCTCT